LSYITKYKITPEKLQQQFIDESFVNVKFEEFEEWLKNRAEVLAKQSNDFLQGFFSRRITV
jgi:hypothetical protein